MNMFAYIARNVAQTSLNPNIAFNSNKLIHIYCGFFNIEVKTIILESREALIEKIMNLMITAVIIIKGINAAIYLFNTCSDIINGPRNF